MGKIMIGLIIFVIALVIVEWQFDKFMWVQGLNDKPWSTILRGILILIASLWPSETFWWQNLLFVGTMYFLLFDYGLNLLRGKHVFHIGSQKYLYERLRYKAGPWIEAFVKLWVALVGYGVYVHLDWII